MFICNARARNVAICERPRADGVNDPKKMIEIMANYIHSRYFAVASIDYLLCFEYVWNIIQRT